MSSVVELELERRRDLVFLRGNLWCYLMASEIEMDKGIISSVLVIFSFFFLGPFCIGSVGSKLFSS